MDELAERYKIAAWKTYTQWGPDGKGFFLDDEPGIALIEKARKLGVRTSPSTRACRSARTRTSTRPASTSAASPSASRTSTSSSTTRASSPASRRALRPEAHRRHRCAGHEPARERRQAGRNVYAELGSTWRLLMRDPDSAAHGIGKLLKYCGEDNVLWGTDSIWYGSPQDQIQAFRTFQIAADAARQARLPEDHAGAAREDLRPQRAQDLSGPEDVLRKHLPRDQVAHERARVPRASRSDFVTHGPKTRREFLNLRAWSQA